MSALTEVSVWPMKEEKRDVLDMSVVSQDQSCLVDAGMWIGRE